jgi:hypothetical protein
MKISALTKINPSTLVDKIPSDDYSEIQMQSAGEYFAVYPNAESKSDPYVNLEATVRHGKRIGYFTDVE